MPARDATTTTVVADGAVSLATNRYGQRKENDESSYQGDSLKRRILVSAHLDRPCYQSSEGR